MPMVVYTEEEMIEARNEAEADGARAAAAARDQAMAENTAMRRTLNDIRDAAIALDRVLPPDVGGGEREILRAHITLSR